MRCVILFLLSFSPFALAQEIELKFTQPVCKEYPGKPAGAFCTREDVASSTADEGGPLKSLLREVQDRQNTKITMATMTFSHKAVGEALCQAAQRGVEVQVLIDAEAEAATAKSVEACGAELTLIGAKEKEGQRGDLHHNKFMLFERKSSKDLLVFATANFSNPGLSINFETWGFVTAEKQSAFMKNHRCLVDSLINASSGRRAFRAALEKCMVDDSHESIQSLFLPTESKNLVQLVEQSIAGSQRVWMASNRFSFSPVIEAFAGRAQNRDSRAIFDDDLFWAEKLPNSDQYSGNVLDAQRINELAKTGVSIRYTQTSFEAAQKMHNKFLILDEMVIVGAGNFTSGGMTQNFENFYVINDQNVVDEFASYYEQLWDLSSLKREIK
ncbi:MAG: phospholipase D-like domain-containing protein [Proteobacteria bacterium]|jgi:phosphatidylserine/phosphatidylglycerophosphate/cardiolipin synthase-like enzyme|nr:phospholipase D-like domain-containing protein [Pseudomonadota bacterium]